MTFIGGANIKLGGDPSGFVSALSTARSNLTLFTQKLNSDVSQAYKRADASQKVYRAGLTKLGDEIQGIGQKMALVGALPALFVAGKAFKDFAEIQRMEKGLSLYGETLEDVRKLAKEPNIGVFDGAKALVGLRAVRLESGLAERAIKSFANAIAGAGGNQTDLEPALFNLKQFKATQHINSVDLRQLANRIPQTMEVLEKAFGTADPEKLNKLGIDKFIEGFITELEKLPKVAGGAAVAMEQASDSFTFFSATIGEGLDKAFNVSGKLSALGSLLDNLASNFKTLDPVAQKAILLIGGMAVVVPVLTIAVGQLIALWPLLAAGFAAISWPIVAVIATTTALAGLALMFTSTSESAKTLSQQQEIVAAFAPKLDPLIAKYEELKNKTILTAKEQKELKDVTKQIADFAPTAATGWDKYGNAIDISTSKVKVYTEEQKKQLAVMQAVRRETLLAENRNSVDRRKELGGLLNPDAATKRVGIGMGQYINQSTQLGVADIKKYSSELAKLNAQEVDNRKELLRLGNQDLYIKEVNQLKSLLSLKTKYEDQFRDVRSKIEKGSYEERKAAELQLIKLKGQVYKESLDTFGAGDLDKLINAQRTKVIPMVSEWNKAKEEARLKGKTPDVSGTNVPGPVSLSALSITALEEKLKNLKSAYNDLDPTAADYKKKQIEISGEVRNVTLLIDKQSQSLNSASNSAKEAGKSIKESGKYYKEMNSLEYALWQIDLASKFDKEKKEVKEATNQYKELVGVVKGLNVELLKTSGSTLGNTVTAGSDRAKSMLGGLGDRRMSKSVDDITRGYAKSHANENVRYNASEELNRYFAGSQSLDEIRKYFAEIPKIAGQSNEAYEDKIYGIVDATKTLNSNLSSALQQAAGDFAVGFGEMIGNLASGAGGLEQFAQNVMGTIGNLLKNLGKSLIGFGTAGIALKVFAKNPVTALLAGVALVALGQMATNSIKAKTESATVKLAKGGLAYGPSMALVGDNKNARFDPEVISPLSKLKAIMGDSNRSKGRETFIAETRIEGQDIVIAYKRAESSNMNLRGF